MIVSLIGFSSTGKSHWAKRLITELGFSSYCCDDLIEQRLRNAGHFNGSGISEVATWMGMPHQPGFSEREKIYLDFEKETMDTILDEVVARPSEKPVVIDTTGSVIYTGDDRCRRLAELSRVVYLDVDQKKIDQMLANFVARPKPIVWNNTYSQAEGETEEEALKRSYHELLSARALLYKKYADLTIPYQEHKRQNLSTIEFIEIISSSVEDEIL